MAANPIDGGSQSSATASGGDSEPVVSRLVADQLCFALYAASRAVTALYRPLLDAFGLTYPQYLVMLALWERDGVPVKALAETLQLDYSTLSPLLKRLEVASLLRRERRLDDERSVLITLTEDGRALNGQAQGVPCAVAEAMALGPQDLEALRVALQDLAQTVRQVEALATLDGAATA